MKTIPVKKALIDCCAKKGVTLTQEQFALIDAAVDRYKDSQANPPPPQPTHKKRRRREFDRLRKALAGLSRDTRSTLIRLADHAGADLRSVIECLPELEKSFAFVESRKLDKKTTDKDLECLILTLADIYEEAFGRKAAATRGGPFQTFVEKSSGLIVNDKTIGSYLRNWGGYMRVSDERHQENNQERGASVLQAAQVIRPV